METFYINSDSNGKFGFRLDKNAKTPTIGNITTGGPLEKILIDRCSNITTGSEILTINGQTVVGKSFIEATNMIKTSKNELLELTILTPKNISPIKKMTVSEMDKISKETTEKALKDLAKSQLDLAKGKPISKKREYESSDDDDFDSEKVNKLEDEIDKLEEKNRLLQFEKMNIEIDLSQQIEDIKKVHEPLIIINDCVLTSNKLYDINFNCYEHTSREIYIKLQKTEKEFVNCIKLINDGKKNINYMGCQILVDNYIEKITKDYNNFTNRLKIFMKIKQIIEFLQSVSIIIMITVVIYQFYDSDYISLLA